MKDGLPMTKKIFPLILCIILVFSWTFISKNKEQKMQENFFFIFPKYSKDQLHEKLFQPTKITVTAQYWMIKNLYLTLVHDQIHGTLTPMAAEDFWWEEDTAVFKIRENLKTSQGEPITVEDILFSLKLLAKHEGTTHAHFRDVVCGSIDSNATCEVEQRIFSEGNLIKIRPKIKLYDFFSLFSSPDFAIIKPQMLDKNGLLFDYTHTTGAYTLHFENNQWYLKKNTYFLFHHEDTPKTIQLIDRDQVYEQNKLRINPNGFLDFHFSLLTTTLINLPWELFSTYFSHIDYRMLVDSRARLIGINFPPEAQKTLTDHRKKCIIKIAKSKLPEVKPFNPLQPANEFFYGLHGGELTSEQLHEIQKNQEVSIEECIKEFEKNPLKIPPSILDQDEVPSFKAIAYQKMPYPPLEEQRKPNEIDPFENLSFMKSYEVFVSNSDGNWQEDSLAITYNINTGNIDIDKDKRKEWISNFFSLETQEERHFMLQKIQYDSLKSMKAIPLYRTRRWHVISKKWEIRDENIQPEILWNYRWIGE